MESRERIRINGRPISLWDMLEETKERHIKTRKDLIAQKLIPENLKNQIYNDKPGYFRYLTILAFHVFIREKVDVAVVEVGVGGSYDATNIISSPLVTAITALGFDHISVLGSTMAEIASHKAGIMKSGVPCFSSPQGAEAMEVLKKKSGESGALFLRVLEKDDLVDVELGLNGFHQRENASLATLICREFITQFDKKNPCLVIDIDKTKPLPNEFIRGLKKVKWPARSQTFQSMRFPSLNWYLDGAHTPESLQACIKWVDQSVKPENEKLSLLFNCTGGRKLLEHLAKYQNESNLFADIVFCTNETYNSTQTDVFAPDLMNNTVNRDTELKSQHLLADEWKKLVVVGENNVIVASNIQDAVEILGGKRNSILVTGSLHLIGGVLTVLGAEVE